MDIKNNYLNAMCKSMKNNDTTAIEHIIREIKFIAFDFDGVFTDNMVYVFENGMEAVRCSRSDGIGLSKLNRLGIKTIIISTETNNVVSKRAEKIGINCIQSCDDKITALKKIIEDMGLTLEEVAFVGNDINDLSCLNAVGLPITVKDAHPDVVDGCKYQTRALGGYGAVREICDLFEKTLKSK